MQNKYCKLQIGLATPRTGPEYSSVNSTGANCFAVVSVITAKVEAVSALHETSPNSNIAEISPDVIFFAILI